MWNEKWTFSSFQYPPWLETNKSKIKEAEYDSYSKQNDIIKQILAEFDKEGSSDTDDVKKQRFEKIMDLMQRVKTILVLRKNMIRITYILEPCFQSFDVRVIL